MGERTPGPWHIKAGYDWVIESQDGVSVAGIYTPRGVREVRQANARFIAAAPDMEKALDGLLRMCFEDLSGEESGAIVEVALAAIAKAKGE